MDNDSLEEACEAALVYIIDVMIESVDAKKLFDVSGVAEAYEMTENDIESGAKMIKGGIVGIEFTRGF